jgi:hypothetical protein
MFLLLLVMPIFFTAVWLKVVLSSLASSDPDAVGAVEFTRSEVQNKRFLGVAKLQGVDVEGVLEDVVLALMILHFHIILNLKGLYEICI